MENEPILAGSAPVECAPEILDALRFAALEAFHKLPWGGLEIGGVLYGRKTADRIEVLDARELPCEHALGPAFDLSEADRQRLSALLELPLQEKTLKGLVAVGLYRSFTRGAGGLTGDDPLLQHHRFGEGSRVMLALYPAKARPVRARFFLRSACGEWTALEEFELLPLPKARPQPVPAGSSREEAGPPAPAAAPPPEAKPQPAAAPPASSEPAREQPEPETPDRIFREMLSPRFPAVEAPAPPRRLSWPRLTWLVLAWVVALGSLGYALRDVWLPRGPAPLQVGLYDLDGQLTIGWQRSAGPLRDAEGGVLEITDGGRKVALQLSRELLQGGTAVYRRQSGDVSVRLAARFPGNRAAEGVARFVGPDVTGQAEGENNAEAARLQEELDKQIKRNEELQRVNADLRKRLGNGKR